MCELHEPDSPVTPECYIILTLDQSVNFKDLDLSTTATLQHWYRCLPMIQNLRSHPITGMHIYHSPNKQWLPSRLVNHRTETYSCMRDRESTCVT